MRPLDTLDWSAPIYIDPYQQITDSYFEPLEGRTEVVLKEGDLELFKHWVSIMPGWSWAFESELQNLAQTKDGKKLATSIQPIDTVRHYAIESLSIVSADYAIADFLKQMIDSIETWRSAGANYILISVHRLSEK